MKGEVRSPGLEQAWEKLLVLEPAEVCRRADVSYDSGKGLYLLESFGMGFSINPGGKEILPADVVRQQTQTLLSRMSYFFKHSVQWYLVKADDFPLTGRLVKPSGLKGAESFFGGSHAIPLTALAAKYTNIPGSLTRRALDLGGASVKYGDEAVEIRPLPRVPVTLLLWRGDEEFPARADLLFDSSVELQLPLDVIWCVAMMSVLMFL